MKNNAFYISAMIINNQGCAYPIKSIHTTKMHNITKIANNELLEHDSWICLGVGTVE